MEETELKGPKAWWQQERAPGEWPELSRQGGAEGTKAAQGECQQLGRVPGDLS